MASVIYDDIGTTYKTSRGADPAISSKIARSPGGSKSVINIGAGTGSYEPDDRFVLAMEDEDIHELTEDEEIHGPSKCGAGD